MEIGTLTITGEWPLAIDGLPIGYSPRRSRRYTVTDSGIVKGRTLYKTHDPARLIDALGVANATHSIKWRLTA